MSAGAAFRFVEGVTSDLSFVADGETLEDLFAAAADALVAATVERPDAVGAREQRNVELGDTDLDLLLLRFLNELIYLRDAQGLVLRARSVRIRRDGETTLRADLEGESLDPARHGRAGDVKAATAHGLRVERAAGGWRATVTLDV